MNSFDNNYIPKILFIKGIFKKDCILDDFFEKKILENISQTNNNMIFDNEINLMNNDNNIVKYYENPHPLKKIYKKLPSIFYDIKSWPEKTDLLCWNCHLNFDSIPVFIPKVIEPNIKYQDNNKLSITVHGVFCSFGCIYKFINTRNYTIIELSEMKTKINFLYKLFNNNNKIPNFSFYPDYYDMVQYGGTMTEAEFKEKKKKINSF